MTGAWIRIVIESQGHGRLRIFAMIMLPVGGKEGETIGKYLANSRE
jgi:hypothetical protein